jgi:pimeloyl-ACP methyl ester carboxylesterase
MSILSRLFAVFIVALFAVTLMSSSSATAQNEAKDMEKSVEPVSFSTVDGITIRGKFYRGPKAAPVVILLHNVGGSETSNHPNWIALAKELQSDFAVLTFDFRGHGNSTAVDPQLFLRNVADKKAVPNTFNLTTTALDIKSINKLSYPILCNDIAAAKSYLERTKNDLGECNTQNIFVVGAEQGATLGAIWANSEYYRYRCDIPANGLPRYANSPEGKYFSGFMWLSLSPKLGDRTLNVAALSSMPARFNAAPFCLFGKGDTKGRDLAKSIEKTTSAVKKSTLPVPVPVGGDENKLVGVELLTPSLKVGSEIHKQLKAIAEKVSDREWEKRDFVKTLSGWKLTPNGQPVHARANFPPPNTGIGFIPQPVSPANQVPEVIEKNILFSTYDPFIPR